MNLFTTSTPIGKIGILYKSAPFCVESIFLPLGLKEQTNTPKEKPHKEVIKISESIESYFEGKILQVPWHKLNTKGLTNLQIAVLKATANIAYGELSSYKEIAEVINRPRAYRVVGSTLAINPFPLLIPCHRVVRRDGAFGQFGGGEDLKKRLINMERM